MAPTYLNHTAFFLSAYVEPNWKSAWQLDIREKTYPVWIGHSVPGMKKMAESIDVAVTTPCGGPQYEILLP
jgi:hypothetical protein